MLNASPSDANVEWGAWDVAPDGRMFAMGNSSYELAGTGHDRQVAYSDDHGLSWTQFDLNRPGPPGGVYGPDIVFVAQSDGYSVLCGDVLAREFPPMLPCVLCGPGRVDGLLRA